MIEEQPERISKQLKDQKTDNEQLNDHQFQDSKDQLPKDSKSENQQSKDLQHHENQESIETLMLMKVFEFLDYDDLLVANRVCKQWSESVCKLVEDKVIVLKKYGDLNRRPIKLLSVSRLVTADDQLFAYSLVQFRLDKEVHKRIKRLVTYNPFILAEKLEFDSLLFLEVRNSSSCHIEAQNEHNLIEINLKNLKYLNLDLHAHCSFKITAPKLLAAKFTFNFQLVTLINPTSLRYLHCFRITNQVPSLKNLKSLSIEDLNYEKTNFNLFKKLPKLKSLYLYDSNKKSFDKLLNHKKEQKAKVNIYLNNLNVTMNGFDFDYVRDLKQSFDESKYAYYRKNRQHLDGELFQRIFRIEKNLNIDMDLFARFKNITILHVQTKQINLNNWIKVLKTLNLNRLFINTNLSQNHLEQIPKLKPNLKWLHLQDYDDLGFVLELKYLEHLKLSNPLPLEEFNQLINALKSIKQISFSVYDHYSLKFTDRAISLYFGDQLLFKEPRDLFLNYTIKMVDSWTELFSQDGSAICKSSSEIKRF